MRIVFYRDDSGRVRGYTLWLSARDTCAWATRPGSEWPCSVTSGKPVRVGVDRNGLHDVAIDGRIDDCPGDELDALVAYHLPAEARHLWPTWEAASAKSAGGAK